MPAEDEGLLQSFDRQAQMEYGRSKGRSKLIRRAIEEYLERHGQRSPQTVLTEIDDRATQDLARLEAGVRYLKAKAGLSIRQIARITYFSRGKVYRIVRGINVKPVRVKNFDVNAWRQRWQLFETETSVEEAFSW